MRIVRIYFISLNGLPGLWPTRQVEDRKINLIQATIAQRNDTKEHKKIDNE